VHSKLHHGTTVAPNGPGKRSVPADPDRIDLQRTVGRNLRRLRVARGMSQEAFAAILGVHRTFMGGVERGERNLTLRSLERVAATLGIDPRELLDPG
jgi:DNA-binding XRE family transcriptional regulator